ncbi:MAG TPA: NPCBM/NEW2 domain-containing protein, partial [Planctomycetaceae bacterium]
MNTAVLLSAVLLAAPAAEVSTVDDRTLSGAVTALDATGVTVETDGAATPVPLDSVLAVRFPSSGEQPPAEQEGISLRLKGGGRLTCRQVVMQDRAVVAETVAAGEFRVPLAAVEAIRFRPEDDAVAEAWDELAASSPERDLLVVRNGDVLDRLEGTISGLTPETLTFLVGDTRVPIDRSKPKLFGVVSGRSPAVSGKPVGELRFRNGDRLPVTNLSLDGDSLKATAAGAAVAVSVAHVEAIDFGGGKVQYLSQLEPRQKEHTPYIGTAELDSVFDVLVDHGDAGPGSPIRIDRQVFKKGLVIHSRTRLTYRLNGEYRRFVAVAGIEQLVRPRGDVDLVITADGKELVRKNVKGTDPPVP